MKFDLVLGNPPYNAGGVKRGGGFFKGFIEMALNQASHFELIVPRTFMIRQDFALIRKRLVTEGLTSIQHLSHSVFDADVDTCIISFEKASTSDAFVQVDAEGISLSFERSFYSSGVQIPITSNKEDKSFFEATIGVSSNRQIFSGDRPSIKYRVAWEYLIGLEAEKYEREKVVRNIYCVSPGVLTKNQRYVEVASEQDAVHLAVFLDEHIHRFPPYDPARLVRRKLDDAAGHRTLG
jgi:hypothetical protein